MLFIIKIAMYVVAWNLIPDSAEWYTKLAILALAAVNLTFTTTRNGVTRTSSTSRP